MFPGTHSKDDSLIGFCIFCSFFLLTHRGLIARFEVTRTFYGRYVGRWEQFLWGLLACGSFCFYYEEAFLIYGLDGERLAPGQAMAVSRGRCNAYITFAYLPPKFSITLLQEPGYVI